MEHNEQIPEEIDELLVQHDRDAEVAALMDEKELVAPQIGGKPPKHLAKILKANAKAKVKKVATEYPWEFEGHQPPTDMFVDRSIGTQKVLIPNTSPELFRDGYLMLRGRGCVDAPIDVLFVHHYVTQAEYDEGVHLPPSMLRCPAGNLMLRNLERAGFEAEDDSKRVKWYYTCIAKYNTVKGKLNPEDIRWGLPALEDEIKTLQPKLIVCFGKPSFDFFVESRKLPMKQVQGAFFVAKKYGIPCYVMDSPHVVLRRPEYTDRFLTDLHEVRKWIEATKGVVRVEVPRQYVTIAKASELFNVLAHLKAKNVNELAVDCEWHGQTAWGGRLRSMQFCWAAGHAAYLRLMDEKAKYAFDRPIETVRQILAPVFNAPTMKFIGHNGSADMPWMHDHLGIEVYKKFIFDTMYAQHTVNEYADLKLERLSVKYTDLGRYDIDLLLWKKAKKFDDEDNEGYGFVPDAIIIPYGCRDVDATFRSRFPLFTELRREGLLRYYNEFVLPFVTDGFHEMMDCGLPINVDYLDDMRDTFTRNRDLLVTDFRQAMVQEAKYYLGQTLKLLVPDRWQDVLVEITKLMREETTEATAAAEALFKSCFREAEGHRDNEAFMPVFMHYAESPRFNINSKAHLKRWLFEIKKLVPIKTTKRDGYFLSWEKVMQMDKKKREELNADPATDKQVIKIYAEREPLVAQLQELQSLSNIVKAFLKGKDEETGKEQGIHRWIQEDGRIHGNFALTETARPRAWKPNILNWPKAITKPIESGFKRINDRFEEDCRKKLEGMSPDLVQDRAAIEAELVRLRRRPTSLRANVEAPAGWCIIDMDLKTAEVVALAWQSGDQNLMKVLTEPDTQFARIDKENPKKVVRICYNSNEGIPEAEWDPALLVNPEDPRILRREDGSILHPKRDLHWEMGTGVAKKPREKCDERMTRDGCGKVGNFSIPYGATPTLLERMIESNTGIKPPDKTGQDMIRSWEERYPVAAEFQKEMAKKVRNPGWWRALSGRVRHFAFAELEDLDGFKESESKGILSGLGRQSRNFPCQEIVAATTARALLMFIDERRKRGLRGRIGILLYDAITAFVPLEEARESAEILRDCLTTRNQWMAKGGTFNFEVDTTVGFRWGVKATAEEKKLLAQYL